MFKALLQPANFTLGPDAAVYTDIHKHSVRKKAPNSVNASKLDKTRFPLAVYFSCLKIHSDYSFNVVITVTEIDKKAMIRNLYKIKLHKVIHPKTYSDRNSKKKKKKKKEKEK